MIKYLGDIGEGMCVYILAEVVFHTLNRMNEEQARDQTVDLEISSSNSSI